MNLKLSSINKVLFKLKNGVQPNMPGYNAHPDDDDRIHCVAFVVNAAMVSAMDDGIIKKIKDIRKEANGRSKFHQH